MSYRTIHVTLRKSLNFWYHSFMTRNFCCEIYFISHTSLTCLCWTLGIETAVGSASMWFYKSEQYDPIRSEIMFWWRNGITISDSTELSNYTIKCPIL